MQKTRVGIVGAGYWGPKLIRNFHDLSNASVSTVCDLQKRSSRTHPAPLPGYTRSRRTFSELLASDVDAVVIATPVATHFPLARAALLAGKHVLVEKPLTATPAMPQSLCDLAKEQQRVLMVGHTFEYNPAVHDAQRHDQAAASWARSTTSTPRASTWASSSRTSTCCGTWRRTTCRSCSIILGRDPINVSARGAAYVQPGIHDVAYLTVNFPNQVMADIQVSWLDPCKIRRITVVGSQKMVVYDDLEPDEKIKIYDKGVDSPPYSDTFEQFKLSYRYGEVTSPRVPTDEPLHVECAHFVECVREGKTPRSSGEVGLKIVRILEKAQASLLNGGQREKLLWQQQAHAVQRLVTPTSSSGSNPELEQYVILGEMTGRKIADLQLLIGDNAVIRSGTVIYVGTRIGNDLRTGHNVVIREENEIGDDLQIWSNSVIDYGCRIGNHVKIHCNCYVAQYTIIEDDAFMAPGVIIANDMFPGPHVRRQAAGRPHHQARRADRLQLHPAPRRRHRRVFVDRRRQRRDQRTSHRAAWPTATRRGVVKSVDDVMTMNEGHEARERLSRPVALLASRGARVCPR